MSKNRRVSPNKFDVEADTVVGDYLGLSDLWCRYQRIGYGHGLTYRQYRVLRSFRVVDPLRWYRTRPSGVWTDRLSPGR
jgi:hypothetical protein